MSLSSTYKVGEAFSRSSTRQLGRSSFRKRRSTSSARNSRSLRSIAQTINNSNTNFKRSMLAYEHSLQRQKVDLDKERSSKSSIFSSDSSDFKSEVSSSHMRGASFGTNSSCYESYLMERLNLQGVEPFRSRRLQFRTDKIDIANAVELKPPEQKKRNSMMKEAFAVGINKMIMKTTIREKLANRMNLRFRKAVKDEPIELENKNNIDLQENEQIY